MKSLSGRFQPTISAVWHRKGPRRTSVLVIISWILRFHPLIRKSRYLVKKSPKTDSRETSYIKCLEKKFLDCKTTSQLVVRQYSTWKRTLKHFGDRIQRKKLGRSKRSLICEITTKIRVNFCKISRKHRVILRTWKITWKRRRQLNKLWDRSCSNLKSSLMIYKANFGMWLLWTMKSVSSANIGSSAIKLLSRSWLMFGSWMIRSFKRFKKATMRN